MTPRNIFKGIVLLVLFSCMGAHRGIKRDGWPVWLAKMIIAAMIIFATGWLVWTLIAFAGNHFATEHPIRLGDHKVPGVMGIK